MRVPVYLRLVTLIDYSNLIIPADSSIRDRWFRADIITKFANDKVVTWLKIPNICQAFGNHRNVIYVNVCLHAITYFDCFRVRPSSFTTSCRRNWYQRTLVVMDCIFPMTWCRKPKVGCGHVCFILQYQSKFGGLICRTSSFSVLLYAPYDPVLNSPKIVATFDKTPGRSFDLCHFLLSQSDLCSFVFYPALQTFASKYVAELYEVAICCLNHINKNVSQQKKHLGSLEVVFLVDKLKWSQRWKRFDRIIPGGGKTNIHKDPLQLGRISFLVSEDCVCEEGEAFVWGS